MVDQSKAFSRQRILKFCCARKEPVDIDIIISSSCDERKMIKSIKIMAHVEIPLA